MLFSTVVGTLIDWLNYPSNGTIPFTCNPTNPEEKHKITECRWAIIYKIILNIDSDPPQEFDA